MPNIVAIEQEILHGLRCLVCQNQSVADSDASFANDIRHIVREQLAAGHSKTQITQFLTERYGDFILYQPPVQSQTLLLWSAPAIALLILLPALLWRRRRRR
jgi:cytochrome c-type biogenesis protein CcmH